ncbi:unnamed protein product, partial [Sphacelaria rigidula]
RAFRRVSLSVHPDKGGHPEEFLRVKRAHDVLKDPSLRKLYDQYGTTLRPSPGHLIGSGTIGRLMPLSVSFAGGAACQFFRVVGTFNVNLWGLGCALTAGGTWLKARSTGGRADSVGPVIGAGLFFGNIAGLCLGAGTRRTVRWLTPK